MDILKSAKSKANDLRAKAEAKRSQAAELIADAESLENDARAAILGALTFPEDVYRKQIREFVVKNAVKTDDGSIAARSGDVDGFVKSLGEWVGDDRGYTDLSRSTDNCAQRALDSLIQSGELMDMVIYRHNGGNDLRVYVLRIGPHSL